MFDEKNKSISFLWELNSIFMWILQEKILLYCHPTWPPCHVVSNQEKLKRYVDLAKANSEVLVYTLKQTNKLEAAAKKSFKSVLNISSITNMQGNWAVLA